MRPLDHVDEQQVMDEVGAVGDRQQGRRRKPEEIRERSRRRALGTGRSIREPAGSALAEREEGRDRAGARGEGQQRRVERETEGVGQVAGRHHRADARDESGDQRFGSDAPDGPATMRSGLVADGGRRRPGADAIRPMTRAPGSPAARSAPIARRRRPAATARIRPMPMLNVRSMSSRGTAPARSSHGRAAARSHDAGR